MEADAVSPPGKRPAPSLHKSPNTVYKSTGKVSSLLLPSLTSVFELFTYLQSHLHKSPTPHTLFTSSHLYFIHAHALMRISTHMTDSQLPLGSKKKNSNRNILSPPKMGRKSEKDKKKVLHKLWSFCALVIMGSLAHTQCSDIEIMLLMLPFPDAAPSLPCWCWQQRR